MHDNFAWGSTLSNFATIASAAKRAHMEWIPCVGPGYDDTAVRPWNAPNTRARGNAGDGAKRGRYYREGWTAALRDRPRSVAVTSFNEWHEGTQIEDAAAERSGYKDGGGAFWLRATKRFAKRLCAAS